MSAWFRSAPMKYVSIIINKQVAHECVEKLGNLGAMQIVDVSAAPLRASPAAP